MEWIAENSWSLWLGLALLLIVAELMSLDLILLMLAGGALAGMSTSFAGGGTVAQVLLAAAVSLAMLALVRPSLVKKLHSDSEVKFGTDRMVGQRGVVTQAISPHASGRVRIAGDDWTAQADDGATVDVGATVEVVTIEGATARVRLAASVAETKE